MKLEEILNKRNQREIIFKCKLVSYRYPHKFSKGQKQYYYEINR